MLYLAGCCGRGRPCLTAHNPSDCPRGLDCGAQALLGDGCPSAHRESTFDFSSFANSAADSAVAGAAGEGGQMSGGRGGGSGRARGGPPVGGSYGGRGGREAAGPTALPAAARAGAGAPASAQAEGAGGSAARADAARAGSGSECGSAGSRLLLSARHGSMPALVLSLGLDNDEEEEAVRGVGGHGPPHASGSGSAGVGAPRPPDTATAAKDILRSYFAHSPTLGAEAASSPFASAREPPAGLAPVRCEQQRAPSLVLPTPPAGATGAGSTGGGFGGSGRPPALAPAGTSRQLAGKQRGADGEVAMPSNPALATGSDWFATYTSFNQHAQQGREGGGGMGSMTGLSPALTPSNLGDFLIDAF